MKRCVVDVDAGIDDSVALLVLLHAEKHNKIKIEAITCTAGNTSLQNVCKNVVRLLQTMGRTDIPVYRGAQQAFIPPNPPLKAQHHGADGFADLQHDVEPDLNLIKSELASIALNRIIQDNPNKISIICLGPLTTLAITIKLCSNFVENVKELYIMGGNYTALGNATSAAEFNFYADPEAAFITLECIKKPITILPIETCYAQQITTEWRFEVIGKIQTPHAELMHKVETAIYEKHRKNTARKHLWYPFDAFLTVAILYPQCVEKQSVHFATVELNGQHTRGQMVIDHLKHRPANVTIIEQMNEDILKDVIKKAHC